MYREVATQERNISRFAFVAASLMLIFFISAPAASASVLQKPPNNLGLVGYWPMNEGSGTVAVDHSGNNNTGTLTGGPTWTNGKLGQALSFNGSSQYVNAGTDASLHPSSTVTVAAWIYPTSNSQNGAIVGPWHQSGTNDNAYTIFVGQNVSNNKFSFAIEQSNGTDVSINPPLTFNANQWYHVVCVADGSLLHCYINGIETGTAVSYNGTLRTTGVTNMYIGRIGYGFYFAGKIDDVRVYNRALSASEVKQLYQVGSAQVNHSQNTVPGSTLQSGLVGLWSFNGADISGTTAYDRSGQGNNGTLTGSPTKTIGKIGGGMNSSAGSEKIESLASNLPTGVSSPWTISVWSKTSTFVSLSQLFGFGNQLPSVSPQGGGRFIFQQNNHYYFWGVNQDWDTGIAWDTDSVWHLVTFTSDGTYLRFYRDGALRAGPQAIPYSATAGSYITAFSKHTSGTSSPNGSIDEARIYNRALSAAEIKQLYQAGTAKINASQNTVRGSTLQSGLVGLWSFDGPDLSGTTAYDRSGQGNNGTLVNSPTKTIGKIGQALSFNGTNQYVTMGATNYVSPSSPFSISLWFKPNTTSGYPALIKLKSTDGNYFELWYSSSGGYAGIDFGGASGTGVWPQFRYATSISTGVWYHVVLTYNGSGATTSSNWSININGSPKTISLSDPFGAHANANLISYDDGNYSNGSIDDIRIYNRALSAAEIKQLYLLGK